MSSLSAAACAILNEPSPQAKVEMTRRAAADWQSGKIGEVGDAAPPEQPARPDRPELREPRDMPKRGSGGAVRRLAFVHAIAHIEFNAINLAWDIIARFTSAALPRPFYDDWVAVALDEAEHFVLLNARMAEMDGCYGDLPAHDGLWQAAVSTSDDLLARLAIVPMILEARGLDTTPKAVERLNSNGDPVTAALLGHIGNEEISHVAAGCRWFEYLCRDHQLEPVETFHSLINSHYGGQLKPPFNVAARTAAGMNRAYYDSSADL